MNDTLDDTLRDILTRYDRPREITQDDAITEIRQAVVAAGYIRPTPLWLAFYRAREGLMSREEWESSKK